MPREARIDIPDHWYHVISRGQRREPLFFSTKDRLVYLKILGDGLVRNRASLGAYCLIPNHVHLLVYRLSASLGTIFRQVNTNYANYFNQKYGKSGYVFQGRFKSFVVLCDTYLGVLLRYIHENPVRARLVGSADGYRWSSDWFYRNERGHAKDIRLVRVPGYEGRSGIRAYRDLMASDTEGSEKLPQSGQLIGTEQEIRETNRRTRSRANWFRDERRDRIGLGDRIKALLGSEGMSLAEIAVPSQKRVVSRVRSRVMAELYQEGYPPSQIARAFKKSDAAVFRACERIS
jgi:REP element-mobilizing transposase RayT